MGGVIQLIRRAGFIAAAFLALSCTTANAQSRQPAGQTQSQTEGNATQQDVASFNRFLSEHPDVEKQLKANPYLINDPNFMSTQPALRAFLEDHPHVRGQLQQSPIDFVRREGSAGGTSTNRGAPDDSSATENEREVGRMDEFLDEHRGIEQQLELNPSLISDSSYLAQHHDLQVFLNAHPQARQEFVANPGTFTERGDQVAGTEPDRSGPRQIGQMDEFLDVHQDVQFQLKQNPVLINDSKYLAQHPDLALFLNAHPEIRQEFSEHPADFIQPDEPAVQPEKPLVSKTTDVGHAQPTPPPPAPDPGIELAKQEQTRTEQFLDDHPNIYKDLRQNPWLINQSKYLKHHQDLGRFLAENPQIREKVATDPTFFTLREWRAFQPAATDRGQSSAHLNPDLGNRELAALDQFLAKHKKTAKELERDPMLVTSQHYIDHNKDLRKFFEEHPQILVEFRQNPRHFMDREEELQAQLR